MSLSPNYPMQIYRTRCPYRRIYQLTQSFTARSRPRQKSNRHLRPRPPPPRLPQSPTTVPPPSPPPYLLSTHSKKQQHQLTPPFHKPNPRTRKKVLRPPRPHPRLPPHPPPPQTLQPQPHLPDPKTPTLAHADGRPRRDFGGRGVSG